MTIKEKTDQELIDRYCEIIDWFYEYSKSDPFGWDWPTMGLLFPELVEEAREIRTEARERGLHRKD